MALRRNDVVRVHSLRRAELEHWNGSVLEVAADCDVAAPPSPDKHWLVRIVGGESFPLKASCLTRLVFAEERAPDTLTKG